MTTGRTTKGLWVCDKYPKLSVALLDDPREASYRRLAVAAGMEKATHRHPADPERRADVACSGSLRRA